MQKFDDKQNSASAINSARKKIVWAAAWCVAAICVWRVAQSFDWAAIWIVLSRANWTLFAVSTVSTVISYWLLRAARWFVLLRNERINVSYRAAYLYTAITVGLSTVTPFQAGEALKVELLKKHGAPRASGYGVFLIERALDLFAVLLLALAGLQNQTDARVAAAIRLILILALVGGAIAAAAIFLLPHKNLRRLREWTRARLRLRILLPAVLLTFLSWLIVVAGWKFAVQAIGVDLDFGQALVFTTLTTLIGIVSLVPGAIGVAEISAANILLNFGFAPDAAQSGAVVLRAYALTIVLLAVAHLIWLNRRKIVFRGAARSIEDY